MSKQKDLVKNTAIITFGKICTQLVSFFLLPLYTAVLSTSEYGIVDLVLTYSSLLLPFVTLAFEQGLFRFLIDSREDKQQKISFISTTVVISFTFSLVIAFILLIVSKITNDYLLFYFGLVLVSSTISVVSLQILRGLGENLKYTISSMITGISQVLCNVLFLVVFKLGAPGMMLATVVGNLLCGVYTFLVCKVYKLISIKGIKKESFSKLYKYSIPLIPNQLSWWALNAADKVIVQYFIGVAGNGLIAVANKFSGMYINFSNIFNISWTESAVLHINDDDAEDFFTKTINIVVNLFLSACCGIIVVMPFVFPIMVNSQYNDAYGLIPIFMLASLCNVLVSLYGVIYVAHKNTKEIAMTAIYAALLNVISHLILIKFFGIYASALSTFIGYCGMAIYRYFHSRKYMVVKLTAKTIIMGFVMILISLLSYYSNNKLLQEMLFFIIVVFCFVVNKEFVANIYFQLKKKLGELYGKC